MPGFGGFSQTSQGTSSPGTLAQLLAVGAADTHLTQNPEVSFWRLQVQKCTNFAREETFHNFYGNTAWGSSVEATIPRSADLVNHMYVILDIPGITGRAPAGGVLGTPCINSFGGFPCDSVCDPYQDGEAPDPCATGCQEPSVLDNDDDAVDCSGLGAVHANWVNEIGFAAIQQVSLSVGGQVIEVFSGHFMHMWEELSGKPGKRLMEMIGKRFTRADLIADSKRSRRLYVPIPFSFTAHTGTSLALLALQFHTVKVHVTFAPLRDLIQRSACDVEVVKCDANGQTGQPITENDLQACIQTSMVYLDEVERDSFAAGSMQQLITQVQQYSTSNVNGSNFHANLNFNHPSKELIWAVQREKAARANNTFDYSGKYGRDPIKTATLKVNNSDRFSREAAYFRLVQPYQSHTNIPAGHIYSYSFALHPEDYQPSGSINFSRIDNVSFEVELEEDIADEATSLIVFARNNNVFRFNSGLGGLLYSN